ncbi:MAG: PP2C family protein-serine/threonine phosphatase, partial [Candidatus Omnitrophica bacterium]|nr:PP2C family protein-serine/threonine phosphatase [Candidatus Omnitrophota bacterium]
REDILPGEMLKRLDDFIKSDFGKMGIYLSAFCGLLDFSDNSLVYSNYGHPPQILFQKSGDKIIFMEPQTFLMGIGMDAGDIHQIKINFASGDRLLLFTDGVTETKDPRSEEFGYERLKEFMKDNASLSVVELNENLISTLSDFQAGEQKDDIFLLSIQIK